MDTQVNQGDEEELRSMQSLATIKRKIPKRNQIKSFSDFQKQKLQGSLTMNIKSAVEEFMAAGDALETILTAG